MLSLLLDAPLSDRHVRDHTMTLLFAGHDTTTATVAFLLNKIGSAEADVPQQIFLGTVVQSVVLIAASLIGGRLSDRTGRRKIFVLAAAIVYGVAMFAVAISSNFNGFLVGMAISGLGFGVYMAVDLALVADVLPDTDDTAKDLGVLNIAGALPSSSRGDRAGHPGHQ